VESGTVDGSTVKRTVESSSFLDGCTVESSSVRVIYTL
jgi:hypothetical protein